MSLLTSTILPYRRSFNLKTRVNSVVRVSTFFIFLSSSTSLRNYSWTITHSHTFIVGLSISRALCTGNWFFITGTDKLGVKTHPKTKCICIGWTTVGYSPAGFPSENLFLISSTSCSHLSRCKNLWVLHGGCLEQPLSGSIWFCKGEGRVDSPLNTRQHKPPFSRVVQECAQERILAVRLETFAWKWICCGMPQATRASPKV